MEQLINSWQFSTRLPASDNLPDGPSKMDRYISECEVTSSEIGVCVCVCVCVLPGNLSIIL